MHPSPEVHQRPDAVVFQHHPAQFIPMASPRMLHPHVAAMQQQQQQQQHMLMMQQHQQQQQQQMIMIQQQQIMMQQQQQQQETANHKSELVEDDVETQHASNKQREHTLEDWHEGLEEEVVQGHEGLVRGASIEELAAAWAQAEAEYEEYARVLVVRVIMMHYLRCSRDYTHSIMF